MQVKEFNAEGFIENQINIWLKENKDKKIIDIKYSADQYGSNGLIVYEEDLAKWRIIFKKIKKSFLIFLKK